MKYKGPVTSLLLILVQFLDVALLTNSEEQKKDTYEALIESVSTAAEVIGNNEIEVTFHLFSKDSLDTITIDLANLEPAANKDGRVYFLIHGWKNNRQVGWYECLKNVLVGREPSSYVIGVDWEKAADQNYSLAAYNTEVVGQHLAEIIKKMIEEHEVPLENIVLIGHSLGGQVCGWAAKKYKALAEKKLPRIIALDPAGPLFISRPEDRRLNRDDATVVHVIHTDEGKLGFKPECGTIDIFRSGVSDEQGCLTLNTNVNVSVSCSDVRSWAYFIVAVSDPGSYPAKKCSNWSNSGNNECDDVVVHMGDLYTEQEGTFFLSIETSHLYSLQNRESRFFNFLPVVVPLGKVLFNFGVSVATEIITNKIG